MKIKYWINNIYHEDDNSLFLNKTIFQKCSEKIIDLPCFCYHENLSIAGNCRMCLVEINTSLKLVVACAMPMQNNLKIFTENYRVKKARENILEFLLINHPLDCPICDQGGECDLQDITLIFGSDKSRFYEYNKRSVYDKECGVFIKMIMTRCIHCTRCVRFLSEVSNNYELGMLNRGNNSEITSFIKKSIIDELSANIIDLCPVGALTSKPFAFTARSWELNSLESIDIFDSMASSIRVDYLNNKIYRILPIYDRYINEDWITNKIRFCYDSQLIQRLYFPVFKRRYFIEVYLNLNWFDSFIIYFFFFKAFYKSTFDRKMLYFFGDYNDMNTILNIKKFLDYLGLDIYFMDNLKMDYDFRKDYILEDNIQNLDYLIIVGLNLRVELPILNSKLRKKKLNKFLNIYNFFNKDYLDNFVNNNYYLLKKLLIFKNKFNKNILFNNFNNLIFNYKKKLKNLNFFLGYKILIQNKISLKNYLLFFFNKFFNNLLINIIISNISYLNLFELGLRYKCHFSFIHCCFVFFINYNNNMKFSKFFIKGTSYMIYNGSYFDNAAKLADVSFPVNLFFEHDGYFFNIEGKLRKLNKIINFSSIIYTSYDLFKYLFNYMILNKKLKLLNFYLNYLIFYLNNFIFLKLNWNISLNEFVIINKLNFILYKNQFLYNYKLKNKIIITNIYNYYKNDIISKFSKNLHLGSLDYSKKLLMLD